MWIMTNTGFVSIVAHRQRPGDLLVRARRHGEIESVFPKAEISRTPDGDYLYRSVISRSEVSQALADRVQNIDYDNFKNSVYDRKLHDAYIDTWKIMHQYQAENSMGDKLSQECLNHVPLPYENWKLIDHFVNQYASEIEGIRYGDAHGGHEQYLVSVENEFKNSARLPGEIPGLLAVIYLLFRRNYWSGQGDESSLRPLVDACLRKIQKLKKPSAWDLR